MGHDADGRIVFVDGNTVPGDRVRIRLTKVKKRWARGELVDIVEPSGDRVTPPCGVQDRCGGCPWMIGTPELRAEQRCRILADEITKVMGADVAEAVVVEDGTPPFDFPEFDYRIRARWAFRREGSGRVLLGYRGRRSHDLVSARDCPVLVPVLRDLHAEVSAALEAWRGADVGEVHALAGNDGATAVIRDADGAEEVLGPATVDVVVAGHEHPLAGADFAQANVPVTERIWRWVRDHAAASGPGHAVELFAGAGTFTTALLDAGWTVDAYDTVPRRQSLEGAHFHSADLLAQGVPLPAPSQSPALVLLDPPRTGAAEMMDWVGATPATTVLYVSCDLATSVRDAETLRACGFELRQALSFDMFPHSGHQEVALWLTR